MAGVRPRWARQPISHERTAGPVETKLGKPVRDSNLKCRVLASSPSPGGAVTWEVTRALPEACPPARGRLVGVWATIGYVGLPDRPGLGYPLRARPGFLPVPRAAPPEARERVLTPPSPSPSPIPRVWPSARRFTSQSQSVSSYEVGQLPQAGLPSQGSCEVRRCLRGEQEGCHWAGAPRRLTARSRPAFSPSWSSSPAGARPELRGSGAQDGAAGRQEQRPAVQAVGQDDADGPRGFSQAGRRHLELQRISSFLLRVE